MNQWIADNWGIFPILFTVGAFILLFWIAYFLCEMVFWDTFVPYHRNLQEILKDSETGRLAQILGKISPLEWNNYQRILKIAHKVENKEEQLEELHEKEEELNKEKGKLEAEIQAKTENLPEKPTRPAFQEPRKGPKYWYESYLSVGLSLMLFLGISEFLGIDIQKLELSLILVLGIAGAICINLAEYRGIHTLVSVSYRHKRRLNSIPQFQWKHLLNDPNFLLTIIIILCETCFAAPGILKFFSKSERQDPKILLTVYAACALAALVNVVIAWGDAKEDIEHEFKVKEAKESYEAQEEAYFSSPQYQEDLKTIEDRKAQLEEIAMIKAEHGQISGQLASVHQQIQRLERKITEHTEMALQEYQKWARSARFWMLVKRKKVEKLQSTYEYFTDNNAANNNGGRHSTLNLSYDNEEKKP
jgi:preprotein translocase subunit Sec61beta